MDRYSTRYSEKSEIEQTIEGFRHRERKFSRQDDHLRTDEGEQSTIGKIINVYFTISKSLQSCSQSRIIETLQQEMLTMFSQLHENLDHQHELCMQDKSKYSKYKKLTEDIAKCYDDINTLKTPINKALRALAPEGSKENPPRISVDTITDDIQKFVCKNLAEICLNTN